MARVSTRSSRPMSPANVGKISPVTFLQETVAELRKSAWPSREETARLTWVVILLSIAVGFFLGGLDRLFAETFSNFVLKG